MSRTTRAAGALVTTALVIGLAAAGAHWWDGESWAEVSVMCCFTVLLLLAAVGIQRMRRKR
ncbi:hypothetical protein ACFC00_33425 [Streptomyces adustus]|uniref:hypothetical protein n=1 Tax=Streptomyces adustus TaxID=1609272 RepID=UPI0035DD563B